MVTYIYTITLRLMLIIIVLSGVGVVYFWWKSHQIGKEIKEATFNLNIDLDNDKALDYMQFVYNIEIPNRKVYWNTLKAGYQLIKISDNVDDSIKQRLRIIMLSKGILIEKPSLLETTNRW
ncbi:hypothetical protein CACET_c13140 [Clostridium aceticum]|uniref:Uncharacterized protein n=1 Tax=Clostridium aceticum TaxID=84022 RepID=A0A0D8IBQ2_9CLOT|nr:hypothetical protein [Clostridium aceticum]AKL94779.1 hypothetical protein CACET_c13140 [Clostridium aceticum]KJF27725.1 hypothetical protein TZ02_03695 [Clostridium aceticum]